MWVTFAGAIVIQSGYKVLRAMTCPRGGARTAVYPVVCPVVCRVVPAPGFAVATGMFVALYTNGPTV